MELLGIIGGTGLDDLDILSDRHEIDVETPYGSCSSTLVHGRLGGEAVVFLARHGRNHHLAPHEIDYRANMWALHEAGVTSVVGVAAVGVIVQPPTPGGLAVPDQLIDYTHGRGATFFEGADVAVEHIDFTAPYTPGLRTRVLQAARRTDIEIVDGGCYGATQGPRLETAAEIVRMERDGCTLVGMTGMPEAALARELGMNYACCAVAVNEAAGKGPAEITLEEIGTNLASGMQRVRAMLPALVQG